MRRLNLSTILLAALFLNQQALANSETDKTTTPATEQSTSAPVAEQPVSAPAAADEPAAELASGELRTSQKQPSELSRDEICQMIEAAADGEALPFEFLARLIWQESKFNPAAVSPAGAVGIAQFMPKVATGRGLADPFEPAAALHESAEFLRELRDRFGNLGLAAAAYNAGPRRVQEWLDKRGKLPRETRNYVHIITGHKAEKWTTSAPSVETAEFRNYRCGQIAKLSAQRYRLAALERFASEVDQRIQSKAAAGKNATRSGVLAKRNGQPANRVEQVAKLVARSGNVPRVDRIIKLTAGPRGSKPVQLAEHRANPVAAKGAKAATQVANAKTPNAKAANVKVASAKAANVKVAANAAAKSSAISAQKKVAAAKPAKAAPGKVRVASNGKPVKKS